MRRSWFLILGFLLFWLSGWSQTTSTDSQTLQALLAEVRQLRQDLRTTTAASQRALILLHRLQEQEATVARAQQRLDDARLRLREAQSHRNKLASELKLQEAFVSQSENPPTDRKQVEDMLLQLKANLESAEAEEQQRQTREMEADDQLRTERAKLTELQDQLDQLQKTLESLGERTGSNPR